LSTEESGGKSHFHTNCAKIFKTYILWLEETQLNKMTQQNIILPPQYDHRKLRQIFHGSRDHWTEYIYLPDLRSKQKADCNSWLVISLRYTPDTSKYSEKAKERDREEEVENIEKIKKKIFNRLKLSGNPLLAPEVVRLQIHIGSVDLSTSTFQLLRNESKILQKFAHQFNMMVSEHKAVDAVYRDSVRYAYMNEASFRMKSVSCSRLLDNCQGSTTIRLEFSEMKVNDAVRMKLEDNREFYRQMVARNSMPSDLKIVDANFCVHNVIQQLLDRYESHLKRNETTHCESIMKIVTSFFYDMLKEINEEIQECPVTQELYSTTISKLGTLVQQNHNTEGINLLKMALQRPNLVNLIADLFTPSVSTPPHFLEMYKCLVDSYAKRCEPQLLFVLFSKFDISTWLSTHKPKLIEVSNLIQLIVKGLELWNFKNSDLLQDLLRCHLASLFMYRFPEHYGEVFQSVLTGFSQQRLKSVILLDLINVLYQNAKCGKMTTEMSIGRMKDEMRNFASKQTFLQVSSQMLLKNIYILIFSSVQ
jgi:ectopic P granules protein 5